ncbi:MAG TPA: hypothetical protein VEV39_06895 [Gemmatimonadales bacterium]|nr:hypothetical protein [Gemmatimonadales bacterium]
MRAKLTATLVGFVLGGCSSTATGPSNTSHVPVAVVTAAGDTQTGYWAASLAKPLVAVVMDSSGHGVPNVPVSFAVLSGGGSVGTPSASTDSLGRATTLWTMGDTVGLQRAVAVLAVRAESTTFKAFAYARPLSADSVTAYAVGEFLTGSAFTVAANCGGTITVNCSGGVPGSPVAVTVVRESLAVAGNPVALQVDITARLAVSTTVDIPLEAAGIQCGLAVNTAAGSIPTVGLTAHLDFGRLENTGQGVDEVYVTNVTLTDLESADVSLNGGTLCSTIGAGASFYLSTLTGMFADGLKGVFCAGSGSVPITTCPPKRPNFAPPATRRRNGIRGGGATP